jgi:hypothetical protein
MRGRERNARTRSKKLVEGYKLHPNAIKNLARCGQGYLYTNEGLRPVSYGMLPELKGDYPLVRIEPTGRGLNLYDGVKSSK